MLALFTKALELVTAADIDELPAQTWPEGPEVEFKKSLPEKRWPAASMADRGRNRRLRP